MDLDKQNTQVSNDPENLEQRIKKLGSALKTKNDTEYSSENSDRYMDYLRLYEELI